MFKNVASQSVELFAFDTTTGAPKTGDSANMVFYVTKDFGTVTAIAASSGVPTEMDATNAKGLYKIALSQAETNADHLSFSGKSSTSNISVVAKGIDTYPANFSTLSVDGSGRVDVAKVGGTSQTARDLGASVLISSGSGAGQLDVTSGVIKANLAQILGTALTETSGQIAAAFKKFFDKATPTGTINSIPDVVAGGAGGLFIAGANAATSITTALTANIIGNITGALSGAVGSVTGAVASVTGNVGGNVVGSVASVTAGVTLAASAVQAIWDALTSALTTVGSIGKLIVTNLDAAISSRLASGSYAAPLDAAGTRTAVGLASANLDTQLSAINAKTTNLPASPAATGAAMTLTATYDFAKGTTAMTEAYAADGVAPSPVQCLFLIQQMLTEMSVASTTLTVKKLDGSTTAATFTLDSGTAPTSLTRTT